MADLPSKTDQMNKFSEIELNKTFDTLQALLTLRYQFGATIATLLSVLLSIAFASRSAGIVIGSAVILWVYVYLEGALRGAVASHYCRCIQLQLKFAPGDDLAFTSLRSLMSAAQERRIREVAQFSDANAASGGLRYIGFRYPTLAGFWIPLVASIVLIVMGTILWRRAGWPLF